MSFLSLLDNPLFKLIDRFTAYIGPAGAPTLWSQDSNGYISPAANRPLSSQETTWMNQFNAERATLNAQSWATINAVMEYTFPLSNAVFNPAAALDELLENLEWLASHPNGSSFYSDSNNYSYYSPQNPDAEADYRLYRLQILLQEAGLSVDDENIVEKVASGVASPIAIDLNGDGIQTSSLFVDGGINFDMNGDGIADKTAWLSGDDAFLAVDKNGNGKIDGVTELFGGQNRGDGFASLATYDSNGDGQVSQLDQNFSDLLLWKDSNMDGVTDENELQSASGAGLESVSVNYTSQEVYESGNLLGEVSTAIFQGEAVDAIDIYFRFKQGADSNSASGSDASTGSLISAMSTFSVPPGEFPTISSNRFLEPSLAIPA